MASSQEIVDSLLEHIVGAGDVLAKKMFGEYGIYCNGKLIGMVSDNQLYVKPTEVGRDFVGDIVEGAPYPGAKPHLLITADRWDDRVWLSQLIRTTADALPSPKKSKTQAR